MSEPTPDAVLQAIRQANSRGQLPSIVAIANTLDCSMEAVRICCNVLVEAGKLRSWQPASPVSERSGLLSD